MLKKILLVQNINKEKIIKNLEETKEVRELRELNELKGKILKNINDNNIINEIPHIIYQTYETKNLPEKMLETNNNLKILNSEFSFELFNDNECRQFIEENFNTCVLETYDNLIPGAYNSDLWRYCILYLNGGIYLDIKFESVNNFKIINLLNIKDYVLDKHNDCENISIYNGLLITAPKNINYLKCIYSIINNVALQKYCDNSKAITGSVLLGQIVKKNQQYSYDLKDSYKLFVSDCGEIIYFNNNPILKFYKEYIIEKYNNIKTDYNFLWKNKYVFKNMANFDENKLNELITFNKINLLQKLNNNYFGFVDKIIYINLQKRNDRKKLLENELNIIIDEKIIRFNAILDNIGCIGCTKSHISVLKMCIFYNWQNCLIIEDDMIWNNFHDGYKILNELNKNNFDVILLGGMDIKYFEKNYKLMSAITTTAYLINKNYYVKLLNNFETGLVKFNECENKKVRNYIFTIDQYWRNLQSKDNWFIVVPCLCFQRDGYSDITKEHVSNWKKYFKVIKKF